MRFAGPTFAAISGNSARVLRDSPVGVSRELESIGLSIFAALLTCRAEVAGQAVCPQIDP
jgi:hypothetical protein